MKNTLIWVCPEMTPYHDVLFNEISSDPQIKLEVFSVMKPTSTHPFLITAGKKYIFNFSKHKTWFDWPLFTRLINEKESSIVISSYLKPTLVLALILLGVLGLPFVYFTDTPLPNDKMWSSEREVIRPFFKRILRGLWLKWIFKHATKVLATGKPGVDSVIRLGCPPEKAVIFPYWVDIPKVKPPEMNRSYDFLCVGQLIERKNYKAAISAFSKLNPKNYKNKINLILIGSGPQKEELQKYCDELRIHHGKVVFRGWLDNKEIQKELKNSFALVHPAKWEPFGVVVLEAMAQGLPILASDKTMAALDRVKDGTSGFIHQTGNVEQLTKHMNQLISNPSLVKKMRKESRKMAEKWPPSFGVKILKGIFRMGLERA